MGLQSKNQRHYRKNVETLESRVLFSTTVSIPGTSDPWIEAGLTGKGAGTAPISIPIGSGSGQVVTFPSVTGTVSGNIHTKVVAGPNGFTVDQGKQNLLPVGGMSGFSQNSERGDFALIGVFTGNTVPKSGPPTTLLYDGPPSLATFSPQLDEVFYIGGGRVSASTTGTIQDFNVPSGATHLYLGFPDGPLNGKPGLYSDDGGSLKATVDITTAAPSNLPLPVSGSVLNDVNGAAGAGLSGWRVYVDANKEGQFDPSDISTLTNAEGAFTLDLAPGTYVIGVEIQNGYAIASPATYAYTVKVDAQAITGLKFILKKVDPVL